MFTCAYYFLPICCAIPNGLIFFDPKTLLCYPTIFPFSVHLAVTILTNQSEGKCEMVLKKIVKLCLGNLNRFNKERHSLVIVIANNEDKNLDMSTKQSRLCYTNIKKVAVVY